MSCYVLTWLWTVQERLRAQREDERQLKLKKAERMAGEMSSKAAEMEAQLDMRVKRAQEEYRSFLFPLRIIHET